MAEFDLIDLIKRRCASVRDDVRLGIGDDAAIVAVPAGHELAICTDTLVAGVHFPAATRPADIGWKSLAVNLSDLAAMGATPAWATLALTLPHADRAFVADFVDGFAELAARHRLALIGGDTTRGPLSITVTAHGFIEAGNALRRDGAQIGDRVHVTGTLGDAAAALHGIAQPVSGEQDALLARLNRPEPRVAAGHALRGLASACIDVSDGLLADLAHVARQSGVGIEIDAETLPASRPLQAMFSGEARLALQLAGGDDYELAFCVPAALEPALVRELDRCGCTTTRIGHVVAGDGVRVRAADGAIIALPKSGWEHFT